MHHDRHIPHLSLLHQAARRSPASSVLDIGTSLRTPSFSFFMVSSKKNKRKNRETIIKNEHGHNYFQTVFVIPSTKRYWSLKKRTRSFSPLTVISVDERFNEFIQLFNRLNVSKSKDDITFSVNAFNILKR